MVKVIGYTEMKKRKGKVVFVIEQGSGPVVGQSCDKVFLYDDISDKITKDSIGKDVEFMYGRGYNGSAYVADIITK